MRSTEFLSEGGLSSGARYNSEIAVLHSFAGAGPFDIENIPASFDSSKLASSLETYNSIERFLRPAYDPELFSRWRTIGDSYRELISDKLGALPTEYGWTGGANAGSVADVEFLNHQCAGISIKDSGGITLKNLSPSALGIDSEYGLDIFHFHAEEFYIRMKRQIFTDVLEAAHAQPDKPIAPLSNKYTITYNSERDTYTCIGKQKFEASAEGILNNATQNARWQRVFGDWFQANWNTKKEYARDLFASIARTFEVLIETALSDRSALDRVLALEEKSYFYATPKSLFYVPARDQVGDLRLKGLKYAKPDGTSQKYIASIGQSDGKGSAEIEIYIRYANGMFEANPTVRIQSIKNTQFIGWQKLY